jgi:hypothetical protein
MTLVSGFLLKLRRIFERFRETLYEEPGRSGFQRGNRGAGGFNDETD